MGNRLLIPEWGYQCPEVLRVYVTTVMAGMPIGFLLRVVGLIHSMNHSL